MHAHVRIRRPRSENKLAPMGLYPALVVLGIYDRCTPKLASDASRAVAMHSSLAEAQAQLRSDGIALDIKTLRSTAYRYAARARAAQQSAACGLLDRVTGKRVVVSLDGGRVRVRRKKRGPKTKKGRNRFHTDWKEPKLLILYVVGDDGRPSQTWAPIIDGTLRGPEAVFALLLSYARQIGLNAADKVLFIADGAPWIWRRLQRLIAALGLSPTQVLGLIDFYHAAKQLSDAVKLRRWSATQRTRWLNRTRGLLKRARVDEVLTALRELCRGTIVRISALQIILPSWDPGPPPAARPLEQTYIQSGNVLFRSSESGVTALTRAIEARLSERLSNRVRAVVFSRARYRAAVAAAPDDWGRNDDRKHNAAFPLRGVTPRRVITQLPVPKEAIETVAAGPGVIFWSISKRHQTRTTWMKLAAAPIYQQLTVRNHRTVLRLRELLEEL